MISPTKEETAPIFVSQRRHTTFPDRVRITVGDPNRRRCVADAILLNPIGDTEPMAYNMFTAVAAVICAFALFFLISIHQNKANRGEAFSVFSPGEKYLAIALLAGVIIFAMWTAISIVL